MKNALTIDVEDYFHVSAFAKNISINDWDNQECRVEKNISDILQIFSDANHKATFFVLGWVAERYPELVKLIHENGHEIASHGYSHQLIYNQSQELFREETRKSKQLLEDIIQEEVTGYRAASYSITNRSLWALDTLVEEGFEYDSSIFPVRHDRYGIPGATEHPHVLTTPNGSSLVEFPLSTLRILSWRVPMAGGGYFRLYPYFFFKQAVTHIIEKQMQPYIFYLHPWEIDTDQPRVKSSWFSEFRHYNNLDKCRSRLESLLASFEFGTVKHVLTDLKLLSQP